MTDVIEDRGQAGAELSAADEQVLRELTERARAGGLRLTGEGGLLGRLTKMGWDRNTSERGHGATRPKQQCLSSTADL